MRRLNDLIGIVVWSAVLAMFAYVAWLSIIAPPTP
jgi:hypothetical protein